MKRLSCWLLLLLVLPARAEDKKPLRAGIIGLDTSHVVAFTKLLNADQQKPALAGVRVVAAYPGGSADIPDSSNRLAMFTNTLRDQYKIEIVSSIKELLDKVDVVLLESVDGRPHLEQVKPVLAARKPVFIDKPVAGSLADAIEIFELAKKYKTPCFSSSSLRYYDGVASLKTDPKLGKVVGCAVHGPCTLEPHHPDLFWYGVHAAEMLYTLMGTGCETVARVHTKGADVVTGTWQDGRVATFRGIRGAAAPYGGLVYGEKGVAPLTPKGGYEPLVAEIVKFFHTGVAPVSAEETIELFAFMEAADESKRQKGAPVSVTEVLERARATVKARSK